MQKIPKNAFLCFLKTSWQSLPYKNIKIRVCKRKKGFQRYTLTYIYMYRKKESEVPQCNTMDYSLPGFSIYGIFQARVLEWVAISFSRGSAQPRDWTLVSCIVDRCFYCLSHQGRYYICREREQVENNWEHRELVKESEVTQSCLTLCNPVDCNFLGSSVHGIIQARILEWVAISFSNIENYVRSKERHFANWCI